MSTAPYPIVEADSNSDTFRFISEGKREIVKVVTFTRIQPFVYSLARTQPSVYNLALTDLMEDGSLSDTNRSNNGDRDKVLATVAHILAHFLSIHPDRKVFFQGSDEEGIRAALYHRAIRQHLAMLSKNYKISGLTRQGWERYNPAGSYVGFLVENI